MKLKSFNSSNIFIFFYCLIPVALISGPLISEIFLILIAIFAIKQIYEKNYSLILLKRFIIFLLSFYFYLLFSSIVSDYPLSTSLDIVSYLRFILFILGSFLIIKNINSEKTLLTILVITFLILFFDSIFQSAFKKNILNFPLVEVGRVSSFFLDELILGSFTVRFLPIVLGMYFLNIKKKYIDLSIISIFIVALTLILLSGERTAFYFFLIESLLILFFIKNYNFEKIICIIFGVIIVTSSLFFEKSINTRFIENTKKSFYAKNVFSIKNSDHYKIYNDFKLVFKNQNKFFGVGPKNFKKLCIEYKKNLKENTDCVNHPHNSYLQILNEIGFVGLIFVLIIFIYFLRELFILNIKFRSSRYFNSQFCIILAIFINLFPIAQTGDFFNNWLNIVYYYPIPFFFKYKLLIENEA